MRQYGMQSEYNVIENAVSGGLGHKTLRIADALTTALLTKRHFKSWHYDIYLISSAHLFPIL